VAVEGVAEVEELAAAAGRHLAQGGDDRIDPGPGRPVGVGVPERAAAFGQPAPAGLRVAQPAAGRERRGVAAEDEAVVALVVAGAAHRPPHAVEDPGDAPASARQQGVDLGLGVAVADLRRGGIAAGPVERAAGDQFAEADVVGADRDQDQPHVEPPRHLRQPVGLGRLAEVGPAAHRRRPEVPRAGARAG
jgi:hypothetical protein